MSQVLTSLCSLLLRDYFGEVVQSVGTYLLKQIASSRLIPIIRGVSLPAAKVKTSLCVLIQHGFCNFEPDDNGLVEYSMKHENVLVLLYYERYVYYAKSFYGETARLIVEEILDNGRLTMSEAIMKVLQDDKYSSDASSSLKTIEEKFRLLVDKHFLIRCPYPHDTAFNGVPNLRISEDRLFLVPSIDLSLLQLPVSDEPAAKKRKSELPDQHIYWKINHDQFIEHFRNDIIHQACSNHMDDKAAEIVKAILVLSETKSNRLSPTSSAIAYHEIVQRIIKTTNMKNKEIDSYLSILCEGDQSFVSKADDRVGGVYVVNIKKVLTRLVEAITASVVQDRFGSTCARIYRILLSKKVMDPKQLEEVAMLQPKECKEHIFKLLKENFIIPHDMSKSSEHGQSICLLYVNLSQVCQVLLERCYQAIFNLMTCNNIQHQENKRLLEKKQRVDAIVSSLKQNGCDEEQIMEVQNHITPPEEAVIKKVTECSEKIDSSQIQISEMILTLSTWLECSKCS